MTAREFIDEHQQDFFATGKKNYNIEIGIADKAMDFHNPLEDASYHVEKGQPILRGTVGEMWTTKIEKILSTYRRSDGEPLTEEYLNQKAGQFVSVRTQAQDNTNFACRVPKDIQFKVQTSWAELSVNRPGIDHGEGDFLICSQKDGEPDFDNVWVVNGKVFENTYREGLTIRQISEQERKQKLAEAMDRYAEYCTADDYAVREAEKGYSFGLSDSRKREIKARYASESPEEAIRTLERKRGKVLYYEEKEGDHPDRLKWEKEDNEFFLKMENDIRTYSGIHSPEILAMTPQFDIRTTSDRGIRFNQDGTITFFRHNKNGSAESVDINRSLLENNKGFEIFAGGDIESVKQRLDEAQGSADHRHGAGFGRDTSSDALLLESLADRIIESYLHAERFMYKSPEGIGFSGNDKIVCMIDKDGKPIKTASGQYNNGIKELLLSGLDSMRNSFIEQASKKGMSLEVAAITANGYYPLDISSSVDRLIEGGSDIRLKVSRGNLEKQVSLKMKSNDSEAIKSCFNEAGKYSDTKIKLLQVLNSTMLWDDLRHKDPRTDDQRLGMFLKAFDKTFKTHLFKAEKIARKTQAKEARKNVKHSEPER